MVKGITYEAMLGSGGDHPLKPCIYLVQVTDHRKSAATPRLIPLMVGGCDGYTTLIVTV